MNPIFSLICFCWCLAAHAQSPYLSTLARIRTTRDSLGQQYAAADAAGKAAVLAEARHFVLQTLEQDLFPAWYGTPWDFNGQTKTPRQGKIACGYFVTTLLGDAGFVIPRVAWAQLASETLILKLNPAVKRFRDQPVEDVRQYLISQPDGLYLVGLDRHIGFLLKSGPSIRFIHASYYQPEIGVMAQDLPEKSPLTDSRYRVIGQLFTDEMMGSWLTGARME